MSAVIATPELMEAAATDLAGIGSTVNAAHMVAAASTVALVPAAADEVSASIAHLFSGYAQDYQALAGQGAAFQEQFVQNLSASAVSYASAEAVNVSLLLQPLTAMVNSVVRTLTDAVFGPNFYNNLYENPYTGGPAAAPFWLLLLWLMVPFMVISYLILFIPATLLILLGLF